MIQHFNLVLLNDSLRSDGPDQQLFLILILSLSMFTNKGMRN